MTLICVLNNKTVMNRAEENSSWWIGLNLDVGQCGCDALGLRFCSKMPVPQGLPPHRQLGWRGSPPACGQSESSPHCVPMPAVGRTENFSTSTIKIPPTASTDHDSSGWLLILRWRWKKSVHCDCGRKQQRGLNFYGEWMEIMGQTD